MLRVPDSLVVNERRCEIEFNWKGDVDFHDVCECFDTGDCVTESSFGCDVPSEGTPAGAELWVPRHGHRGLDPTVCRHAFRWCLCDDGLVGTFQTN